MSMSMASSKTKHKMSMSQGLALLICLGLLIISQFANVAPVLKSYAAVHKHYVDAEIEFMGEPKTSLTETGTENETETETETGSNRDEDKLATAAATENATATANDDDTDFDEIIWPQLHQKLCPNGAPDLSLNRRLFELGRRQVGIPEHHQFQQDAVQQKKFLEQFFDGGFSYTLMLTGDGPRDAFLYVIIWKCNNNAIRSWMLHLNKKRDGDSTSILSIGDIKRTFPKQWQQVKPPRKSQVESYDDNSFFSYENITYARPCIFTSIRDPISHFLSGYNEADYRAIVGNDGGIKLPPNKLFDKTTAAPYFQIPYNHTDEEVLQRRFETFVFNVLEQHPSLMWPQYKHAWPMSRVLPFLQKMDLLPPPDLIFPPTKEHSNRLPEFLGERCPSLVRKLEETNLRTTSPSQHVTSSDPFGNYKAAKDVWKKGGKTARALCSLHAFDYACFYNGKVGLDKDNRLDAADIPAVCRGVYNSPSFREAILGTAEVTVAQREEAALRKKETASRKEETVSQKEEETVSQNEDTVGRYVPLNVQW